MVAQRHKGLGGSEFPHALPAVKAAAKVADEVGAPRLCGGIGQFRAISDGNRKLTPRETGVPLMTQFTIGDRDTGNGFDRMKHLQFADNFSIHHDRHNFKMGVEYQRVDMNRASANNPRGALTFNANQGGYDFASFLMGYPASVISPDAMANSRCFTLPRPLT